MIAATFPVNDSSAEETLKLVANFSKCEDARVRCAALNTLVILNNRGVRLGIPFYHQACDALTDDYEIVKLAGLQLISVLACQHGKE